MMVFFPFHNKRCKTELVDANLFYRMRNTDIKGRWYYVQFPVLGNMPEVGIRWGMAHYMISMN